MTDSPLLLSRDPRGVVRLTLNRPSVHNAFDERLIDALFEAFDQLRTDAAARVVILDAAGRNFCAGADIGWMQRAAANDHETNLVDAQFFAGMMAAIDRCPHPVVAKVQGVAYGGGVGLACAADIAIASTRARFCVSEAKFGIIPAVIGPYLVNAVGPRQARRLALSCTVLSAEDACAMGLVQQVTDESGLDAAVEACVTELLQAGPQAQAAIKQLYSRLQVGPVTGEIQELTAQTISRVRAGAEARAGFVAFFEKRPAPWVPGS